MADFLNLLFQLWRRVQISGYYRRLMLWNNIFGCLFCNFFSFYRNKTLDGLGCIVYEFFPLAVIFLDFTFLGQNGGELLGGVLLGGLLEKSVDFLRGIF